MNLMESFGHYNALNRLSGGDITKHRAILDLTAEEVFFQLAYLNKRDEVMKAYAEVRRAMKVNE